MARDVVGLTISLTEEELTALAAKTIALQADAPKCSCPCSCQYVLVSSASRTTTLCFACRHAWHYGGTPLLKENT